MTDSFKSFLKRKRLADFRASLIFRSSFNHLHAKMWKSNNLLQLLKSLIYKSQRNRRGPSTDPRGTPWVIVMSLDLVLPIETCERLNPGVISKHKRATRNGDVNNHIAEHHLHTKHQIDWDSATWIAYSTDYYERLSLESWFTNFEQTPLNRSQQLPAPYKRLD